MHVDPAHQDRIGRARQLVVLKSNDEIFFFFFCIVYISLFQFSWVQYKEFQFISTYNFFGYNQFELRVPFRLTNEGFDTWHPLWIYSQCPQAFMSKSTFFHFELSSGALSFTFYEYVFRFLILIFNLIIYLMS